MAAGCGKTALTAHLGVESGFPFVKRISADDLLAMGEGGKCGAVTDTFNAAYRSPLSMVIIDDVERVLGAPRRAPHARWRACYAPPADCRPCRTHARRVRAPGPALLQRRAADPDGAREQGAAHGGAPRVRPAASHALAASLPARPRLRGAQGRKLFVVATTSNPTALEDMGLTQAFNVTLPVPVLNQPAHLKQVLRESDVEMDEATMDRIASSIPEPISIKKLLLVLEMARQEVPKVEYERFMECMHACGW